MNITLFAVGLMAMLAAGPVAAQQMGMPAPAASAPTKVAPEGVWITGHESEVTIAECPQGYCGVLSTIVIPQDIYEANKAVIDAKGAASFRDIRNMDPRLRDRAMLGLQILTLSSKTAAAQFEGALYNPRDGKTYFGRLTVLDPDHIELTGCTFFNLLCMSKVWMRPPATAADAACPAASTRRFELRCQPPN